MFLKPNIAYFDSNDAENVLEKGGENVAEGNHQQLMDYLLDRMDDEDYVVVQREDDEDYVCK